MMESNKKVDSLAGVNKQRVILITYLIAALDITWLFLQFSITPVSNIVATPHCGMKVNCIYCYDGTVVSMHES